MRSATAFVQGRMLTMPVGKPTCRMTSPNIKDVNGVCGAGFNTMGFPTARAGATLWATRFSGKLNGVMPSIGPMGTRRYSPKWLSVPGVMSNGTISPGMRLASSAATVNVMMARPISRRASVMGLPDSEDRQRAKSSLRAVTPSAIFCSAADRTCAGSLRLTAKAATAARMASSASDSPARQTSARTSPL